MKGFKPDSDVENTHKNSETKGLKTILAHIGIISHLRFIPFDALLLFCYYIYSNSHHNFLDLLVIFF